MIKDFDNKHYVQFTGVLSDKLDVLDGYFKKLDKVSEEDDVDLLKIQKRQVETLVKLENQFKRELLKSNKGKSVYKKFISYICDDKKNILTARPFFRERQGVFTKYIAKALKNKDDKKLQKFHFNFNFIQFALNSKKWNKKCKLYEIYKDVSDLRMQIVVMNMPLAINRATMFFKRTPKAQLTHMDLIQISTEGLLSAIDKFCLPFSRVFRAVAIGRMTGNFIECYNETLAHFYPGDKRKIYRANKILGRKTDVAINYEDLVEKVNAGINGGSQKTNVSELINLLAAQSSVSIDIPLDENKGTVKMSDRFNIPSDQQPDEIFEKTEALSSMNSAIDKLDIFEQKFLKLHGMRF